MTSVEPAAPVSTGRRLARLCSQHRYALLGAALVLGVVFQALDEQWSSDVYEHLAVVRELSRRPFDPSHPLLPIATAHPFFSPYTVALGIVGNVSGLAPVTLLKLATVVNAVLLLVGYRRFVTVVTGVRHADFFGLLAVLLLWGPTAWRLSGFLNLGSIGYGMSYPSAFATALMLFALAEVDLVLRDGPRAPRLVAVSLLVATILLTHPITGIATASGILGFWIGRGRALPHRRDVPLLAALAGSFVLVTLWPYTSFWRLLTDNGDYVATHDLLYENLPLRLAPLVVLGALLAWGRPHLRSEPLLAWASIGVALYVIGFVTGQDVLGRSLAFIALATLTKVGVVVAEHVADPAPGRRRTIALVAAAFALVGLVSSSAALVRMVPRAALPGGLADDERLASATDGTEFTDSVPEDAVVVALPEDLADVTPAFAGKVVSSPKPLPFVEDEERRELVVRRVFSDGTSAADRERALRDEGVEVVVFDDRAVGRRTADQLRALGTVRYERDHVVVVSLAG